VSILVVLATVLTVCLLLAARGTCAIWVFYYVGLAANILALALIVLATGGLTKSPFLALFVAFVLIGQQLSRYRTQARTLILSGFVLAVAMLLVDSYIDSAESTVQEQITIVLVLLTFGFSGILSWLQKPPNPLAGHDLSKPPTQAHVYKANNAWQVALYRGQHTMDAVVPDEVEDGQIKDAFEALLGEMAGAASWPTLDPDWPAGYQEQDPPSFRVKLRAKDEPQTYAFLESGNAVAFAHRGGSSVGENGLSVFHAITKLGYTHVETDVRTTQDEVPLIFHDENLQRMTGRHDKVRDVTAAEAAQLKLPNDDTIPTLEEALEEFPELMLNIDLKDDASVRPVCDVLKKTAAFDRVCVTSFSEQRIASARNILGPRVCTGIGIEGALRFVSLSFFLKRRPALTRDAAVLQLPFRWHGLHIVTRGLIDRAHEAGLAVHVWTLNDESSMQAALDLDVDGVMTDQPELLKRILVRRGKWRTAAEGGRADPTAASDPIREDSSE